MIGDFARWGDRVVLGCDDTAKSEFLNKHPLKGDLAGPGQSQSNLWFLAPAQLDSFGPALGRGAVWMGDDVKAGIASEPMLFSGFRYKSLQIKHAEAEAVFKSPAITLELDALGNGQWKELRQVPLLGPDQWIDLSGEKGIWIRLRTNQDLTGVAAVFHFRGEDKRAAEASPIFAGLGEGAVSQGVIHARGGGSKTLRFIHDGSAYDLDGELHLKNANDPAGAEWTAKNAAIPASKLSADSASAFYLDASGKRWRFPKGTHTDGARVCREVCTERNLLNAYGTFYEMPAENAGGFPKIRPIATHNRAIFDYASYRGLLVMSGISADAKGEHIVRSDDGKCALWIGAVDDLWSLGKPRGSGGPWHETAAKAGVPSDPYLATGFDKKRLTLTSSVAAIIRVEADFTGTGAWSEVIMLHAAAGQSLNHQFSEAFGAYWLRIVSDQDTTATATFLYE